MLAAIQLVGVGWQDAGTAEPGGSNGGWLDPLHFGHGDRAHRYLP